MFTEPVHNPSVRQEQRLKTERAIIDAAESSFITHGYKDTTIRAIATNAGVSVGSVMSVGDKSTLLIRVFETKIEAVHKARQSYFPIDDTNPTEATLRTVAPFLEIFNEHQDLAREYFSTLVRGSHTSIIFDALADDLRAEFTQIITHFGTHPDPERAAQALYLGFLGVLVVWAGNPGLDPLPLLRDHVGFFFGGPA